MLDILKSEGNFVIKFAASTIKLYLCIAITSKEGHKHIILEVVQNYSCTLFRSLNKGGSKTWSLVLFADDTNIFVVDRINEVYSKDLWDLGVNLLLNF